MQKMLQTYIQRVKDDVKKNTQIDFMRPSCTMFGLKFSIPTY